VRIDPLGKRSRAAEGRVSRLGSLHFFRQKIQAIRIVFEPTAGFLTALFKGFAALVGVLTDLADAGVDLLVVYRHGEGLEHML
jgi:hypothetical protein